MILSSILSIQFHLILGLRWYLLSLCLPGRRKLIWVQKMEISQRSLPPWAKQCLSRGVVVCVVAMQEHVVETADKGLSITSSISRSRKQNQSKTYNVHSKISQARPSSWITADMPNSVASQLYTYGKTYHTIQRLLQYDFNYVQIGYWKKALTWNRIKLNTSPFTDGPGWG